MALNASSVNTTETDRSIVLIVDDDLGMRETAAHVASIHGIHVCLAPDGNSAIAAARSSPIDLALVDNRLPDMSGLDLIRAARGEGVTFPWIFMSGSMTVELAVEAMKLGALDAKALPFDLEAVLLGALATTSRKLQRWPIRPITPHLKSSMSAAERWVTLVLRGCDGDDDLVTEQVWASSVGVSYRSLTASCQIVDVLPFDARNFTRVFRALLVRDGHLKNLSLSLMVSDSRTLANLLKRAGLSSLPLRATISPDDYLGGQRFIDPKHEVLDVLRSVLARLPRCNPEHR